MKDTKKVAPSVPPESETNEAERITPVLSAREAGLSSKKKCPYEDSHDGLPCGYCGQTINIQTVPAEIIRIQRERTAARDPGTDSLFKGMGTVADIGKRRRAKMYLIAERVRQLFVPDGITTQPIKGHSSDESCNIEMTFAQGTYVDPAGKRREHSWLIRLESRDHMGEGDCPECEGELETEILDNGTRRVACDDCGYEHSRFCGVEVRS